MPQREPKLWVWDYDENPWDQRSDAVTFSIGLYQWVPKSSGTGLKKSKTIRVIGFVAEAAALYAKADELCEKFNREKVRSDAPPTWLQKQYTVSMQSAPKPPVGSTTVPPSTAMPKKYRSPTVKDHVTEMARNILGPELKQLGFRRSGRKFWRDSLTTCQIIDIYMGRWGTSVRGQFGVMLSVFWHEVEALLHNPAVGKMPAGLHSCTFNADLEWLTGNQRPKRWDVELPCDMSAIGREVLGGIMELGIPWLEHRSRLEYALLPYSRTQESADPIGARFELLGGTRQIVFHVMSGQTKEALAKIDEWYSGEEREKILSLVAKIGKKPR